MKMQPQTTIAAIAKAKITSCICCIVVFSTRHTTGARYLRSYATVLAILRYSPRSAAPHGRSALGLQSEPPNCSMKARGAQITALHGIYDARHWRDRAAQMRVLSG